MTAQFARGPQPRAVQPANAPHAALLIDFDNVTMGIRSDLTKELKNLLNSDIIKGKVAVQRAYADWRRYPQYIVPLAENSVDLIFAPAYGSSKKNATDIRLAIDALELVFTRSEIGTFILLSGDSDFSSLVLKLKEYGKYVIGVGIRESSSDLLVQNCDEYYSYSGLTGLTRAGEETSLEKYDPWELVEIAVRQMVEQRDVMRSDRLKQILLELDPNFDEKALGFTKFNRFLQEASNKGLIHLKKMENGQFEVGPSEPQMAVPMAAASAPAPAPARGGRRDGRAGPRREAQAEAAPDARKEKALPPQPEAKPAPVEPAPAAAAAEPPAAAPPTPPASPTPVAAVAPTGDGEKPAHEFAGNIEELQGAYELLQRATSDLARGRGSAVRDSDVKRRMLELRPGFDEGKFGFSKFSRFLRQAHDAEVINLQKVDNGSYEVSAGSRSALQRPAPAAKADTEPAAQPARREERPPRRERGRGRDRERERRPERDRAPVQADAEAPDAAQPVVAPEPAVPVAEPVAVPVRAEIVEAPAARAAEPVREAPPPKPPAAPAAPAAAASASASSKPGVSLGYRRGSRGGPAAGAPPPILAGQTIAPRGAAQPVAVTPAPAADAEAREDKPATRARSPRRSAAKTDGKAPALAPPVHALDRLGLPTADAAIVDHLAGYKGVGRKSAEATVQAFGSDVFRVLNDQPDRVKQTLGPRRADQLLKGWQQDLATRVAAAEAAPRPARKTRAAKGEQMEAFVEGGASASARKKTRRGGKKARKKTGGAAR